MFENVFAGQPVRHCVGSHSPGPSIQLQFWGMQGQWMMSSAAVSTHPPTPAPALRNKTRALSLIWKDKKAGMVGGLDIL